MKESEFLRAALFERPRYIPMTFAINGACWAYYDQEQLLDLMEAHPFLFPNFQRPKLPYQSTFPRVARKDAPYTDDFGCVWETSMDGITGTVTGHPLADWDALDRYVAPDPAVCMGIGPMDWAAESKRVAQLNAENQFTMGNLRHGHTFLQLSDLRGYMNLTYDMADDEPKLMELVELVEHFNQSIVNRYVNMGVDMMGYAEDLGMQQGPMISPEHFRKYIKPSYKRLMKTALDKDVIVHLHSDGDIRELVDDLVDDGVQVFNLQDLVNGIDWIADRFKGKVCVELDLDRQFVTPSGRPKEVDALIRHEVETLASPAGGFAMIYGLYPGVPIENVKAVMDAMEKYAFIFD